MEKNDEIKKDLWYEFICDDQEEYVGKCVREPFLNKIKGAYEAGFLCNNKKDKNGNFPDFSVSLQKIKRIREVKEPEVAFQR